METFEFRGIQFIQTERIGSVDCFSHDGSVMFHHFLMKSVDKVNVNHAICRYLKSRGCLYVFEDSHLVIDSPQTFGISKDIFLELLAGSTDYIYLHSAQQLLLDIFGGRETHSVANSNTLETYNIIETKALLWSQYSYIYRIKTLYNS